MPKIRSKLPKRGKVIAVCVRKNRQNDPAVTSRDSDDSVLHSPALPSDSATACAVSARIEQRVTPAVSDMVQLALARVQDIAGSISLDGPLQAAFDGLLTILQTIDRHGQNKAAIASLRRRLHRLWRYLCNASAARDGSEQSRRDDLISLLQETSGQLTELGNGGLGYQSVSLALAQFSTELNHYLAEYELSARMHTPNCVVEIDTHLRQFRGSAAMDLPGSVTRHCIILVDATGHEHKIPTEFCMSLQQMKNMLNVLFASDTDEACIQRRYLEQGQYDLCIDQGTRIAELTSGTDGWSSIEAGTKVVMRVIIKKNVDENPALNCDGCGYSNFALESVGFRCWTIYCRECQRRYQISNPSLTRNKTGVTRESTDLAMSHLIRNMHVQETFSVCHLILGGR